MSKYSGKKTHRKKDPKNQPKNFKMAMKNLLGYCRPYTVPIVFAVVFEILGVFTRLVGPGKISEITNLITEGLSGEINFEKIKSICIFLVCLYLGGALLSFFTSVIMTVVTQKINFGLRDSLSDKIHKLPVAYLEKRSIGDTLSRITNDVDLIGSTIQSSVASFISALTMFVGCIVIMFCTELILFFTVFVTSLLGFLLVFFIMGYSQKYYRARQNFLGSVNGHVEETYTGQNIVKLFNGEDQEQRTFDELNQNMYESDWKALFFSGVMQPLMNFTGNFGYVAVCVVGSALAMQDVITFGTVVAFTIYVRLFTAPLSQLAQTATSLQMTAAAAERVFEFLKEEEMAETDEAQISPEKVLGKVEFDHVRFGYEADHPIIKDFSETIQPGQKVAIVGPTGAGKTTLVSILMRFYDLDGGEIRIDGIPTSRMTRENIHALFGMVLQDTWLFQGTVRDNLCYGKENITDEMLDEACKAAGILSYIRALPKGYETVLDETVSLSAGQKQLMTIARSMIEDAPMLILDEATSSVDTRTEILIQNAMERLMEGRTAFVIAHRLSTIRNADKILVLKDGNIIESGNHEQLLAKQGFYAELYNSQFDERKEP